MSSFPAISTRSHPDAPPARARSLSRARINLANPGLLCVAAAVMLSVVGIIAVSTTQPGFAMRQAVFLIVGVLSAAVVAFPHYIWLRRISYPLLALMLAVLVFILIPVVPEFLVRPQNGARRWINLGIIDFQPSEIAKIAFVLALANYLRVRKNYRRFFGLFMPFVLTLVPMALILVEPDLGTSLLFLPTLFAMLIAAGAKLRHVALIIVLGLSCAPLMYPMLRPHQKVRILAMIDQVRGEDRYIKDIGYQADRAMTLVGAGLITGAGGAMAEDLIRFNSLPYHHNDMIFAVVSTRWGLFGGMSVIAVFMAFIIGGVLVAGRCREPFGRLVAVGCIAIVFSQMTINIGMTIGLLPITGMTLPFVSYGGSSLISTWLMTGILFNIAMRPRRILEREPFEFDDDEEES